VSVPAGGYYLYGFVRSGDLPVEPMGGGVGEPPGRVEGIAEGEVAALATPVGTERIAPRRASLLAHAEVLRRAFERGPVLPLRFGFVMPDAPAVRMEIASRAAELTGMLDAMQDRAEMNVSASYHEDVMLREVLAENPAIAAAQRRIRGRPAAAVHFERIRLGEMVAHALDAKRGADAATVMRELEPLAVSASAEEPREMTAVVNAAFLVDRGRLEEFDAAVERLSSERAARMQFKLIGPGPPHSFVGTPPSLSGAR
jgi:hypothetical protein